MAYVEPTAATFKARFPTFAGVADATIEQVIVEAASRVDETWPEADYTLAKMLYVAHSLTLDGVGASNEAKLAGFKRIEIGPIKLERSGGAKTSTGGLDATSFGARFAEMARANFAGPLVA